MSTMSSRRSTLRTATTLIAAVLLAVSAFDAFALMPSPTQAQIAAAAVAAPEANATISASINARQAGDMLNAAADTPLVVIDRVIVAPEDVDATIGDAQILSVDVVTDAAKLADYGERARDGAIFITTSRPLPGAAVEEDGHAARAVRAVGVPTAHPYGVRAFSLDGNVVTATEAKPLGVPVGDTLHTAAPAYYTVYPMAAPAVAIITAICARRWSRPPST